MRVFGVTHPLPFATPGCFETPGFPQGSAAVLPESACFAPVSAAGASARIPLFASPRAAGGPANKTKRDGLGGYLEIAFCTQEMRPPPMTARVSRLVSILNFRAR
jgi:hypothetical protein